MKLRKISSNETEISAGLLDGTVTVLFSYDTPVAVQAPDGVLFKTNYKHRTTTRHINKWLKGRNAIEKDQFFFNHLLVCTAHLLGYATN